MWISFTSCQNLDKNASLSDFYFKNGSDEIIHVDYLAGISRKAKGQLYVYLLFNQNLIRQRDFRQSRDRTSLSAKPVNQSQPVIRKVR